MGLINPERLKDIRIMRNKTVEDVAHYLDISKQAYYKYETGITNPNSDVIEKIVRYYDLPITYLSKTENYTINRNSPVFYRKTNNTRKKDVQYSKTLIKFASEIGEVLNKSKNQKKFHQLNYEESMSIQEIAIKVRDDWGVRKGPIENITELLERNGIFIFQVARNKNDIYAYSQIINEQPYIVINKSNISAVRHRYSLAHELGHIILHNNAEKVTEKLENEADQFAYAFLMPEEEFANTLLGDKLDYFVQMKRLWKVPIATLIKRAEEIDLIDQDGIARLKNQYVLKRWIRKEPLDSMIEIEYPIRTKSIIKATVEDKEICKNFLEEVRLPGREVALICGIEYEDIQSCYRNLWSTQEQIFQYNSFEVI